MTVMCLSLSSGSAPMGTDPSIAVAPEGMWICLPSISHVPHGFEHWTVHTGSVERP